MDNPKVDNTIQILCFQMALACVCRILWLLNCCINPVIYATTIPAFKRLIKELFKCNFSSNERHESEPEMAGIGDTRAHTYEDTETSL